MSKNIAIAIAGVGLVAVLAAAAFRDQFPSFDRMSSAVTADQVIAAMPPSVNQQFVAVVERTKRQYIDSRGNAVGLREARAREICAMGFPQAQVLDWTGRLILATDIQSGRAVIRIEIAPGVHVSTRITSITDVRDNSLLLPNSTVARQVSAIPIGSRVRFSGSFVADNTDCIRESSLTLDQILRSPNFIMRFSAVERL